MNNRRFFLFLILSLSLIFLLVDNVSTKEKAKIMTVPTTRIITLREIETKNKEKECWMTINNKVYDFTSYIDKHPAPKSVFLKYCGKEATKAYNDKGGLGESHTKNADKLMEKYLIGVLKK